MERVAVLQTMATRVTTTAHTARAPVAGGTAIVQSRDTKLRGNSGTGHIRDLRFWNSRGRHSSGRGSRDVSRGSLHFGNGRDIADFARSRNGSKDRRSTSRHSRDITNFLRITNREGSSWLLRRNGGKDRDYHRF